MAVPQKKTSLARRTNCLLPLLPRKCKRGSCNPHEIAIIRQAKSHGISRLAAAKLILLLRSKKKAAEAKKIKQLEGCTTAEVSQETPSVITT